MKALVTGATGLVGSHLVESLLERGDSVRALVRDETKAEALLRRGVQLVRGNLSEPDSLKTATQGIDVVYHCAARVTLPFQGNREFILRTNVDGTRHLLQASVHSSVKRFVFVSSVAVYGDAHAEMVREDHRLSANGPYAESKILAEQLVRECEKKGALQTVILRPCVIYGPRDSNFLPQISQALPGRRFPLVNGGHQPLDMVYVTDVADALILAGTEGNAIGQTYNVTDGERHSIRELVEQFGKTLNRPPRTMSVPYPIAYSFALLSYGWSKMRNPKAEPLISPGAVRAMAQPHHYDISKIQRELSYTPRVPLGEGLKRAVDWYLQLK